MKVSDRMGAWLLAMVLIVLGGTGSLKAQVAVIPFEQHGQHLYIGVKAGNGEVLRFIFDTGTTGVIIDPAAAKAGIQKDEHQIAQIAGVVGLGKNTLALNQLLEIGGLEIDHINLAFNDLSEIAKEMGTPFDGLIGYDILNRYVMQSILKSSGGDVRTKGYTAIPFEFNRGVLIPRFPISITLDNGKQLTGRVIFDTGNQFSLLVSAPFNKFHDMNAKLDKSYSAWGMNPKAPDRVAMIKAMSFNGFDFGPMSIRLTTNPDAVANDGYLGIIGLPVITRFSVILDYANKMIYLKPNKTYKKAFVNEGIFGQ